MRASARAYEFGRRNVSAGQWTHGRMPQDTKNGGETRGRRRRAGAIATALPAELDLERALDCEQTGAILNIATITLAQWRGRGEGPAFFRIGRNVRYRLRDVLAWRDARTVGKADR